MSFISFRRNTENVQVILLCKKIKKKCQKIYVNPSEVIRKKIQEKSEKTYLISSKKKKKTMKTQVGPSEEVFPKKS